jgi:sirohydrochlorin cobaltochelatase
MRLVKGDSRSIKKAILVVSFGTSYADTRKVTIEACEAKIKETFSDYEVRRAFTSSMIIRIMKIRDNIHVDTPEEALQKLQTEGFSEVIVQPLHIIPGSEFHDVVHIVKKYESIFEKIHLGVPLLATTADYIAVVDVLKEQLPVLEEHEAVVFMGHGTHHPANTAYAALERMFDDQGLNNVFVGTVDGYPELDQVIQRLQANKIEKVTLMPFMLVAGDHAKNDMASDEEDSWKTILKKAGYVVDTCLHGLGENPGIQAMYVQHIHRALEGH